MKAWFADLIILFIIKQAHYIVNCMHFKWMHLGGCPPEVIQGPYKPSSHKASITSYNLSLFLSFNSNVCQTLLYSRSVSRLEQPWCISECMVSVVSFTVRSCLVFRLVSSVGAFVLSEHVC